MTKLDHEVVVVGAGPAGASAAITLARAGVDTLIADKASFPRDKCCGDGLTALALRMLDQLGLDPAAVQSWQYFDGMHIRAPGGRHIELPLPEGRGRFAAVTRRIDLDSALVDVAIDAGASISQNTKVNSVTPRREHIEIGIDDGSILRCGQLIAADGMWSPIRKLLHLDKPGYRGEWHALRQYRSADGARSRELWVWFEPDLLPGYAWSFPLPDGVVNVGFCIARSSGMTGKEVAGTWRELLDRPHIAEVLGNNDAESPHKAWPIPANIPDVSLVGPRTLFVGDAARATDPMTGEGIGKALETGMMAAQAIVGHRGGAAHDIAAAYERSARRALVADHQVASGLSRLLKSESAANTSLSVIDLNDWSRRNFARWLFEDYPRASLFTPRRWRRGLFTSPGGYKS
ncbi:MAG: geranylgeranyl reductase family protein [Actinomycetia bacterium]|nr:geranylgeranyl reductase family protein [Actinomycetes bacterium]